MSTQAANVSREKAFCFDYLHRNAKAVATLNDSSFYFAELGMQEIKTAGRMCELLEKAGFKVERGISGFVTGFCATCGFGTPVIAIHTEYDANPDNSQASGIAEQRAIVEGASGHCEAATSMARSWSPQRLPPRPRSRHSGSREPSRYSLHLRRSN